MIRMVEGVILFRSGLGLGNYPGASCRPAQGSDVVDIHTFSYVSGTTTTTLRSHFGSRLVNIPEGILAGLGSPLSCLVQAR